jgi:hypothetical protein
LQHVRSDRSVDWRDHHPSATELTNWSEPNGSWRVPLPHTRVAVAVSICLGVTATTRPSQKHDRATVQRERIEPTQKGYPMNTTEKFYRFAAECEFMAKLTHNPKNKTIWTHMAERWVRCAELFDRQSSVAEHDGSMKRHRKTTHHWAH